MLLQTDEFAASEVDIFSALVKWSKAEAKREEKLPALLKHIRFTTMSLRDLMKVVKPSGLVPETQLLQILDYQADPESANSKQEYKEYCKEPRCPPAAKRAYTNRFEDNTGIIWYLGSNNDSWAYTNPSPNLVEIKVSQNGGSETRCLFDRQFEAGANTVENSYGSETNPWVSVHFKKHEVQLSHWLVAQGQDHFIRNWRFEASLDGVKWITLKEYKEDATLSSSHTYHGFPVKSDKFYSHFRLYLTGASHMGEADFDFTEFEFYGLCYATDPDYIAQEKAHKKKLARGTEPANNGTNFIPGSHSRGGGRGRAGGGRGGRGGRNRGAYGPNSRGSRGRGYGRGGFQTVPINPHNGSNAS
jgi:hypothetical protein